MSGRHRFVRKSCNGCALVLNVVQSSVILGYNHRGQPGGNCCQRCAQPSEVTVRSTPKKKKKKKDKACMLLNNLCVLSRHRLHLLTSLRL